MKKLWNIEVNQLSKTPLLERTNSNNVAENFLGVRCLKCITNKPVFLSMYYTRRENKNYLTII